MYTNTFGMTRSTPSMSRWKLAGQPNSPMGDVNWPFPGMVKAVSFCELHLPESGSEIQSGEDSRISSADVADAFGDLLHGVFVDVGVLVQFPKVLYYAKSLSLFLWNAENG